MQFFLAQSSWLWLLVLAVIPILVHLFARSNPPQYHFSNTAFLHRILKKTARVRKPQDWLLLLLRTLAILALLAAFLQPLLIKGNHLTGGQRTTIFLIDRSASMSAKSGGSDRFSLACQKASELLKSGRIDQSNIVWLDAFPDSIFPQPGPNLDYLRDRLARENVRQESGALSSALGMATTQLELVKGKRELVIISDFQHSAWQDFKLETPPGIEITKVAIGGEETSENLAITSLFTQPAEPVVGQKLLIVSRIKNFSDTPRRTTLYLESGGNRQSREVNIPAWGETEVNFQTHFTRPGLTSMTAGIAEDTFSGDDTRHLVLNIRDVLRFVSVAPADDPAAKTLARLAASLSWLEHRITQTPPPPHAVDFLFFHHWKGQDFTIYHEHQIPVFAHPALGLTHEQVATFFGLSPQSTKPIAFDTKPQDTGWKASISAKANLDSPVLALFKSGEFGNPAEGVFKNRFQLSSSWDESIERLIDYQDGIPALLRKQERVLWNLSLAPEFSTWPGQSTFLPFMAELLLDTRTRDHQRAIETLPGSRLSWTPTDGVSPESLSLHHAQAHGSILKTETKMTTTGIQLLSEEDAEPGIYHWKVSEGIVHQQASNFPSEESDLRTIDPDLIAGGEVVDSSRLLRRAALGDGIPFWHWLITAALLFLLIEALVSLWKPKPSPSA